MEGHWKPIALAVFCASAAAQSYSVTDLGNLGTQYTIPQGINNSGQVTGWSNTGGGEYHPFLWVKGQIYDLGTPLSSNYSANSIATAINNSGQIAGYSQTDNNGQYDPLLAFHGSRIDIDTSGGDAYAINSRGEVVGSDANGHAVIFSGGQATPIPLPGTIGSVANGVNDNGEVVGQMYLESGAEHAFLYNGFAAQDLETFGGTTSEAFAINNRGQVVGYAANSANVYYAFLYSGGAMQQLPVLPGTTGNCSAHAINNAGAIVGVCEEAEGHDHAFLYANGAIADLNSLASPPNGATFTAAYGINDHGQIIVTASNNHGYLLTPQGSNDTIVPVASQGRVPARRASPRG